MSPQQVRNQIARRILTDDHIDPRVLEAFGIDLSAKAEGEAEPVHPPLDDPNTEDEIYRGVVPFEVQVSVSGLTHTFDCRAVYTATLTDDGSLFAIGSDVLGECQINYQILTWEPKARFGAKARGSDGLPLPRWVPLEPGQLFPHELRMLVRAMIERDAWQQQESDT